jgi:hypothetical protein
MDFLTQIGLRCKGFLKEGNVSFASNGNTDVYSYIYDNRRNNMNTRTLQSFSTNASTSMIGPNGTYYTEFQIFLDYYGDTNYGDKWVTSAALKQNTAFSNK